MARAGVPDLYCHAAQVKCQFAGYFVFCRITTTNHQGWPGQAGHAFRIAEQARKALHLALHVLRAALHNQLVGALAGNDFCRAFGNVSTGTQHAHRVVMRQQHIFDGLVADAADTCYQVLRHGGRGRGVADHDEFVANDDTGIGVTLGRVGPAVRAELLEGDFFIVQVGLGGKGF